MPFQSRQQAGRLLAERIQALGLARPLILAFPRGGVPIAFEIARALRAPLDVLVVRKIGAPSHPEYGIGAIAEQGYSWIDAEAAASAGATAAGIERIVQAETRELDRRIHQYRGDRKLASLRGRSVVVVDDGLATGVTARMGCHFIREQGAARILLAVPVCAPRTAALLRSEVDEVVCLEEPEPFHSVGQFYEDFDQVTDQEVVDLLAQARSLDTSVTVTGDGVDLQGELVVPPRAEGVVIFAHGSGSSRLSPRNQEVARSLNDAGFGTLLFDLLTENESRDRANVFDIPLLASRLVTTTRWLREREHLGRLRLGMFGASTGAGAALWAAADLGNEISAVVSRGGRPDLAVPRLKEVLAPTLLLVGGLDQQVIELNEQALGSLASGELVVVPGATHLFEEPGALEAVSRHAIAWFARHLGGRQSEAA